MPSTRPFSESLCQQSNNPTIPASEYLMVWTSRTCSSTGRALVPFQALKGSLYNSSLRIHDVLVDRSNAVFPRSTISDGVREGGVEPASVGVFVCGVTVYNCSSPHFGQGKTATVAMRLSMVPGSAANQRARERVNRPGPVDSQMISRSPRMMAVTASRSAISMTGCRGTAPKTLLPIEPRSSWWAKNVGIRWDTRRSPLARPIVRVDKIAALEKEPCKSENVGLLRRLARSAEGLCDRRITVLAQIRQGVGFVKKVDLESGIRIIP